MIIGLPMSNFMYKGMKYVIVESKVHGPTGYKNLEFRKNVQQTATQITLILNKAIQLNLLEIGEWYFVEDIANHIGYSKLKLPTKLYISIQDTDSSALYYFNVTDDNIPLIVCSSEILTAGEVDRDAYTAIVHECVHLWQWITTGEYGANTYDYEKFPENRNSELASFGKPQEPNAYLHQAISTIESIPGEIDEYRGLDFYEFMEKIGIEIFRWSDYEKYIEEKFTEQGAADLYEGLMSFWRDINRKAVAE